ncbi:IcmL-like protein [Legionella drozanskii LLAP-1]|uniref:IcmL-like protein n=1 Tax=Legionella drozanskii LLAP-1 TaxID=1212489 RepID=A0A0W0SW55_9GAMM|nr:DotI/IcmL family type IV secretion protein [Legionella drozanskii]KTC87615.1 IcmL-like protein [Legionella drozanskii LLAP-1]
MKKSMLCAGLMTILSTTVYAEDSSKSMNVNPGQTMSGSANAQSNSSTSQGVENVASDNVPTPSPKRPNDKGTKTPSNIAPTTPTSSNPGAKSSSLEKRNPANAAKKTIKASRHASATTTMPVSDAAQPTTTNTTAPAAVTVTPVTGTTTPATGTTTPATGAATPATGTTTPATGTATPATGTTTPATGTATPAADTATPATGATIPAVGGTATATVTPPQPLNCNYRIPAETTHIEQTIVMKWAENAAEQSFDFDHNTIDNQLSSLKSCYTEQGWQGFNDALQKSGNLNAIKSQQLMVSSMVNGESKVIEIKDNQWKVVIPMQVVYQNDKEKLTQPLTINLVVGRKISGDLGIMQMIAIPRQTTTSPANNNTGAAQSTQENTGTPESHQP